MTTITIGDKSAEVFQAALNTFLKYGRMAKSTNPDADQWQAIVQSCREMREMVKGQDPNDLTEVTIPNILLGLMATSCLALAVIANDAQVAENGGS